jgi:hypothetical protein
MQNFLNFFQFSFHFILNFIYFIKGLLIKMVTFKIFISLFLLFALTNASFEDLRSLVPSNTLIFSALNNTVIKEFDLLFAFFLLIYSLFLYIFFVHVIIRNYFFLSFILAFFRFYFYYILVTIVSEGIRLFK